MKYLLTTGLCASLIFAMPISANAQQESMSDGDSEAFSLITETPEQGFDLAVMLARRGVTTTQPDKDVLVVGRGKYSRDPDALIAASHVVAVHFQTVAAANNYWCD
jgi:hypothetical protein